MKRAREGSDRDTDHASKPTYEELEGENARLRQRVQELEHKFKAELQGEAWRELLWDSDLARDKIHPELGAGWTAVLKEACCVRKDKEKDKVNRLRKDVKEPLRLWPKTVDDDGFVTTVFSRTWCRRSLCSRGASCASTSRALRPSRQPREEATWTRSGAFECSSARGMAGRPTTGGSMEWYSTMRAQVQPVGDT